MRRTVLAPIVSCLCAALALPMGAAEPGRPDRGAPPVPGPVRPLQIPEPARFSLGNGLPVLAVERHGIPLVSVLLVVRSGAAADPASSPGLASFTADMLDEGAAGKDTLRLDDETSFLGADLSTGSSWDASFVSLTVPAARFDQGLALMSDVALRPDFPEKELVRLKKEALTDLLQARSEPSAIAARAFAKAVFGDSHRYGRPSGGEAGSISSFSAEQLRTFHRENYRPGNATLIVVGDVDAARLKPSLEKAFGDWPAGGSPPAPVAMPPQVKGRRFWLVDKPGAAQSSIRIGRVGPSRLTPDFHALEVMNSLLGGLYTSRLNDNLREKHGYTYGAGSRFDYRRSAGVFTAAADVQTKSTGEAMTEFLKELQNIKAQPTPQEVERARNFLGLRFAERFETSRQIAERLASLVVFGLPTDTYNIYVPKVLSISGEDMVRMARAQVDTSNMAFVVVGDRATVEKPLRALKLGELRVLSIDEVMGPAPAVE